MRNGWRAGWVLGLSVVNAVACGSDSPTAGGVKCGPGTVLSGDQCLPQCGAGTELQGVQCVPAGQSGSAGTSGGTGGAGKGGGAHAGEAPGEDAGAPPEDAGAPGDGGADNAGAPSGGKAGAGGTGASGSAGMAGAAGHGPVASAGPWLTFSHSDGVFLYDAAQFPDSAGLSKVSTHAAGSGFAVGPFSPNGQWLAYVDGGDLYVRDMSGSTPGAPVLLLDEVGAFDTAATSGRHCYWSADSKSLAFVSKGTVYVLPVTESVPSVQRYSVSPTAPVLAWSPVGSRLVVVSGSNVELLDVHAGIVTKDTSLYPAVFKAWSPDATSFVGAGAGSVVLTDVTVDPPVPHTVSAATLANPTVIDLAYSATGSTLAYLGLQDRPIAPGGGIQVQYTPPDLYTVALKPALGARVRVTSALDATTGATAFTFSRNGDRLAYLTQPIATYGAPPPDQSYRWTLLNISGAQAGTSTALAPFALGPYPSLTNAPASMAWWDPNGSKLIAADLAYSGARVVYDASGVNDPVQTTNVAIGSDLSFAGQSSIFAGSGYDLNVADLDNLKAGYGRIQGVAGYSNSGWSWSANGKFILSIVRSGTNQPSLTRVDGIQVSTPVALYPTTSSAPIIAWWQPLLGG